ncbi:hypothetical protein GXW83_12020 [Streptacidiphilus sp. PB12-B1b]|uniref:hypothetical protein n=1 Tax=Streptacidiphilus sp. PB12-B1b TaxID=2705012 RepID=UPI0015FBC8C1|nr:hypothetical protein [Streptacidiphilus sp. PB12-B1b]QMU76362.1 hypothetical protein GXW83_12020 [Streptacidiphilus sp. PB12-B1b]
MNSRTPPVVVGPLVADDRPYRRVMILGHEVGRAYGPADVDEFCRRAGLADADLDDPATVTWTGGGPEDWSLS